MVAVAVAVGRSRTALITLVTNKIPRPVKPGESESDENEVALPPARRRIDHALRFLVSQISKQKHG